MAMGHKEGWKKLLNFQFISQCVQRTSGEKYNTQYLQPPVKQAGASVMV